MEVTNLNPSQGPGDPSDLRQMVVLPPISFLGLSIQFVLSSGSNLRFQILRLESEHFGTRLRDALFLPIYYSPPQFESRCECRT